MYKVKYVGGPGETSEWNMHRIHRLQGKVFEWEKVASKEEKLKKCHWWLVCDGKGRSVGFGGMQVYNWKKPFGFVFLTGILPEHRNQGLKKRLVRAMEKKLRSLGIYRLVSYASYWNLASANSLLSMGYKLYTPSDPAWGLKWSYFLRKEL